MSAFQDALTTLRGGAGVPQPPPRTLPLPPSVWASDWRERPSEVVVVGLRLLADAEEQTARAEATRFALELHPEADEGFVEAYNDALIRWLVARGICDPNDVRRPYPLLPMAEDQVRGALTGAGLRFIFDALEALQIETSPLYQEADDDELHVLAELLSADEPLAALSGAEERRARRLLRFVLQAIAPES